MVPLANTGTKPRSLPGRGSGGGTWRHTLQQEQTAQPMLGILCAKTFQLHVSRKLLPPIQLWFCKAHKRSQHKSPHMCTWLMLATCCGSVLSQCSCSCQPDPPPSHATPRDTPTRHAQDPYATRRSQYNSHTCGHGSCCWMMQHSVVALRLTVLASPHRITAAHTTNEHTSPARCTL